MFLERFYKFFLYKSNRTSTESSTRHPGAKDPVETKGEVYQLIQFGTRYFIFIPKV